MGEWGSAIATELAVSPDEAEKPACRGEGETG